MTSEKQIKANQANSKKSTGAKTTNGKLAVATNSLKHGLFAQRLMLQDESLDEYAQLVDGLISSLNPVGTLERLLVEKIAIATWKQLRLTKAESASIEIDRRITTEKNRQAVSIAMGRKWSEPDISIDDFTQDLDQDKDFIHWCNQVIAEASVLESAITRGKDIEKLKKCAPCIYEHLVEEAESEDYELADYVSFLCDGDDDGFHDWTIQLYKFARDELAAFNRRELVQSIAIQLKTKLTAPINNELLVRYQASIDNELYRAIDALRKQQEWRSKSMVTLEAEAA
jgi:hypothetical protein